ncbi:amidohydrolase family protein [Paenibacillus sp. LHD-117]|uniref:amidohydrolase family protein n=1 Tax=Paenibacillus sp. LHD-117 TaxID=3071412 RepID=UPI0027DF0E74|nr:amidohydrolase family protein [Paenibacillus sp. LHD-117]MDQ6421580.1 amidohydrolase family protein [Paenibacillus sp. LHD-117]
MRIDAHQHYWKLDRNDYGWLTPESPTLYRDYLPNDLIASLARNGISKTIVVQAAATVEETEFLLSLCKTYDSIAGVVGWLDFEQDDFVQSFERLRQDSYFVGVRLMLQSIDAMAFLENPLVIHHLKWLEKAGFPVDLLIRADQFPAILNILKLVPRLNAVIDHIGKPKIIEREESPWKEWITEVAEYSQIYCKLSGMVTEGNMTDWEESDFRFYVEHVIQAFGAKRVMFGSDWPVCLLAASYDQTVGIVNHNLPSELTEQQVDDIFGHNAIRFYQLR